MEKETIIYETLESSDVALTCREIFERGAKEYYSMEELSRTLYELRQQGVIFHGRKVANKHTYMIPNDQKTNVILGDKTAPATDIKTAILQEMQSVRFCDNQLEKGELNELIDAINAGLPFLKERMPRYSEYLNKAVTLLESMK